MSAEYVDIEESILIIFQESIIFELIKFNISYYFRFKKKN